ncbi:phosphatidylserine decarboxylase [Anaeramoeba ignava]|uniref:phosphatidylserine decarboxylase n=1 Tax=Anaeramoeba ignava TaxID=1746090 RepID=A0A9Q0L8X1_ANAIG|nr:phosphatidylserine decarboxylase [Anaeramoeba ignava]
MIQTTEIFILTIKIISAIYLLASDYNGFSDPYVKITAGSHIVKTSTIQKNLNPNWNESFQFIFHELPELIHLEVFDADFWTPDDPIGDVYISNLTTYLSQEKDLLLSLENVPHGKIHLQIKLKRMFVEDYLSSSPLGLFRITLLDLNDFSKRTIRKNSLFAQIVYGNEIFRTTNHLSSDQNLLQEASLWITDRSVNFLVGFKLYGTNFFNKEIKLCSKYLNISHFMDEKDHDIEIPLQSRIIKTDSDLASFKNGNIYQKSSVVANLHARVSFISMKTLERDFWTSICKNFDKDLNGMIDKEEFIDIFQALGSEFSAQQLSKFFGLADRKNEDKSQLKNNLKYLSFDEFEDFVKKKFGKEDKSFIKQCPIQKLDLSEKTEEEKMMIISMNIENSLNKNAIMMKHYKMFSNEDKKYSSKRKRGVVFVMDRKTGIVTEENMPANVKIFTRSMFLTKATRKTTNKKGVREILKHLTIRQGEQKDRFESKKEILPFIKRHNINVNEFLLDVKEFKTFNEFFYRKLKPGARSIDDIDDEHVVVSPADCRISVFPTISDATQIWIKGKNFTLLNLFGKDNNYSAQLASQFDGGSLMIARLAPQDYHRFHWSVGGEIIEPEIRIPGAYFTVSQISVTQEFDIYTENIRIVSVIETKEFGKVIVVSVGATCVGSIILTTGPGDKVLKGDEHGYFQFGGSTLLYLFQKGTIVFEKDVLENSIHLLETLIRMGERIGYSTKRIKEMEN